MREAGRREEGESKEEAKTRKRQRLERGKRDGRTREVKKQRAAKNFKFLLQ